MFQTCSFSISGMHKNISKQKISGSISFFTNTKRPRKSQKSQERIRTRTRFLRLCFRFSGSPSCSTPSRRASSMQFSMSGRSLRQRVQVSSNQTGRFEWVWSLDLWRRTPLVLGGLASETRPAALLSSFLTRERRPRPYSSKEFPEHHLNHAHSSVTWGVLTRTNWHL